MRPARDTFTLSVLRMGWRLAVVRGREKTVLASSPVSSTASDVGVGVASGGGAPQPESRTRARTRADRRDGFIGGS